MQRSDIAERTRIEDEILAHVCEALRIAVNARIESQTAEHWLERFCFLGESFARHIRRLFSVEEEGGYMDFVVYCQQPTLGGRADALREEHVALSQELREILSGAREVRSSNLANLYELRQRMSGFLARIDDHRQRERELWLEAFSVDIGGEG